MLAIVGHVGMHDSSVSYKCPERACSELCCWGQTSNPPETYIHGSYTIDYIDSVTGIKNESRETLICVSILVAAYIGA